LIGISARAGRQIRDLRQHFESLERYEALLNLTRAVREAIGVIETAPMSGQTFPRPYPQLARPGQRWLKCGHYWIGYRITPPVIIAVFYDQANIPGRM
jgi:hypothetical protein